MEVFVIRRIEGSGCHGIVQGRDCSAALWEWGKSVTIVGVVAVVFAMRCCCHFLEDEKKEKADAPGLEGRAHGYLYVWAK